MFKCRTVLAALSSLMLGFAANASLGPFAVPDSNPLETGVKYTPTRLAFPEITLNTQLTQAAIELTSPTAQTLAEPSPMVVDAYLPEYPTFLMGGGALAILLGFAWKVHSQGTGVARIDNSTLRQY
jgi:hypothetical protein